MCSLRTRCSLGHRCRIEAVVPLWLMSQSTYCTSLSSLTLSVSWCLIKLNCSHKQNTVPWALRIQRWFKNIIFTSIQKNNLGIAYRKLQESGHFPNVHKPIQHFPSSRFWGWWFRMYSKLKKSPLKGDFPSFRPCWGHNSVVSPVLCNVSWHGSFWKL